MANPEHLAILKQGVEVWNRWREKKPAIHPDLSRAHLEGAQLSRVFLSHTNLRDAHLEAAILSHTALFAASLRGANLREADLRQAYLEGADLSDANLHSIDCYSAKCDGALFAGADARDANFVISSLMNCDFSAAVLRGVNFTGADLRNATLSQAELELTNFGSANLRGVKGLDSCTHFGPSVLDFWAFVMAPDLPMAFARSCGLPEIVIQYLPSMLREPIPFYSCFISYSTRDQDFADRLYADLQNIGVRCWFAPHDVKAGKKLNEQIDEAIHLYDRLLLILSEHSMNSEWVKTEIAKARQREIREKHQMLFPIGLVPFQKIKQWSAFDADTGKDSAREIREYFIPDFSNWKDHDSYEKAFERLLKDLKADRTADKEN